MLFSIFIATSAFFFFFGISGSKVTETRKSMILAHDALFSFSFLNNIFKIFFMVDNLLEIQSIKLGK